MNSQGIIPTTTTTTTTTPQCTFNISYSQNSSNTTIYPCVPKLSGSLSVIIFVFISPFHVMILIVLTKLYERLPRHKFFLSLSISDILQISVTGIFAIVSFLFGLKTSSIVCQVLRQLVEFNAALTLVAAGLSILALSVERYIQCIYCLRAHVILNTKRIKAALIGIWFISAAAACLVLHPHTYSHSLSAIGKSKPLAYINISTTFSTAVILLYIQVRLFLISKEKLKVDTRAAKFGTSAEASDFRKRQLKITIVASAVVLLYCFCMLPLSCLLLYIIIVGGNDKISKIRTVLSCLVMVNTIADPLIYGFGMADTRKLIRKQLKKIKIFRQNEQV